MAATCLKKLAQKEVCYLCSTYKKPVNAVTDEASCWKIETSTMSHCCLMKAQPAIVNVTASAPTV